MTLIKGKIIQKSEKELSKTPAFIHKYMIFKSKPGMYLPIVFLKYQFDEILNKVHFYDVVEIDIL